MIVAYKECQDCIYYSPIDKFYCHCSARDKKYHYGQWVPCEDKKLLEVTLLDEVDETVKAEESGEKAEKPVENAAKNTEETVPESVKPKRTRKKKEVTGVGENNNDKVSNSRGSKTNDKKARNTRRNKSDK